MNPMGIRSFVRVRKKGEKMAIQFVSVKCPNCGADLSIEDSREFAFCSFCGRKILLHNENEHIYRNIDEARIREAENERILRLKELELEEREKRRERKATIVAYGVALAFVAIGALICIFEPLGGMCGIIIGAYIAIFAYCKNDSAKGNKRRQTRYDDVAITAPMIGCKRKNYNTAAMVFRNAGFTNINLVPLRDLTFFNQRKNGQVETITIDGEEEFDEGDVFPKNANILITYHSKQLKGAIYGFL